MDRPKPTPTSHDSATPKATVGRLSLYLRHLEHLIDVGETTISSTKLGDALDISDAQVRKDLGYFGPMGYPGVGYRIKELRDKLRAVLGTNRTWKVAIIGLGNLGRALLGHVGFHQRGFVITALFDNDAKVVGTEAGGHIVRHVSELPSAAREMGIELAVLAVPAKSADPAARLVQESGISGILNFAPVRLTVGKDVSVVSVDLGLELEQLAFQVSRRFVGPDDAIEGAG
jgi:redox-sensing transcriptional repressor